MNIRIVLSVLFLSFSFAVYSQSVKDAEQLFNEGKYKEAYSIYEERLSKDTRDALLNYKAGRCQIGMKSWWGDAEKQFKISAKRKYYKSYFYLGQIYFNQYRFVEAVENFDLYKELRAEKLSEKETKLVDSCLLLAQLGVSMIQRVEDVAIVDSVKYAKDNFFSAYRLSRDLGVIDFFNNIFPKGTSESTLGSALFMSGRKDRMIFAQKTGVNNTYDLQIAYRLIDGWAPAVDLSKNLNTDKDDNFPFVFPDGLTIYFGSKGHNSLGGYDIFFSRYNNAIQEYTEPQNIGMPFNSPANDYMYVVDEMAQVGWFATDRGQNKDTVIVYEFIPNKQRTLLKLSDYAELRELAQLKRYRKAIYNKKNLNTSQAVTENITKGVEISFVVNDTLTYTNIEQFKSEEAKDLYLKFIDMDKKLLTNTRLLEGKRREYMLTKEKEEQKNIYLDILKIEDKVFTYTDLLEEFLLKTRRAEIAKLTGN